MSDVEEPVAKISKLENQELAEGEEMDNGQEEWLSEEILTDDDYNPAADQDQSDSNANTSQEEGNTDSMDQGSQDAPNSTEENIEQTLNNLENSTPNVQQAELPEELGAFLVRKTERKVPVVEQPSKEPESEMDESTKQSEDDGNDTDDLLRMLGEDNSKKKDASASQRPQTVRQKEVTHSSDDDDDEYIYEGAKMMKLKVSQEFKRIKENSVKKLKTAKGVLIQKPNTTRVIHEDTSEADAVRTVSKVSASSKLKGVSLESNDIRRSIKVASKAVAEDFSDPDDDSVQKHPEQNIKLEGASSDEAMTVKRMFNMQQTKLVSTVPRGLGTRRRGINAVKTVTKRVISIDPKSGPSITTPTSPVKTITKFTGKPPVILTAKAKVPAPFTETRVVTKKSISQDDMDEHELMNDDMQDMESDMDEQSGQRLMRPERMDEEVPTDADSHTDEDSYYDDIPSSDSEDADDWFTLDVRAERAADYIPMLGEDAKALLAAEQQRAAARLGALRRSANALVTGRRSLAAQLRVARTTIAQIDSALAQ